jgi:NAD(P)-dependent dehydrogenase (short-subunit alcohol dehydrogenase family)
VPIVASKRPRVILVTGSCGLIGSHVVRHFAARGFSIAGVDGNHRATFFGPEGDNTSNLELLRREVPSPSGHWHTGNWAEHTCCKGIAPRRRVYGVFLTLCKDADPDIPILKEAKTEYAGLQ